MNIIVTNGTQRLWVFDPSEKARAYDFAAKFKLDSPKDVIEVPFCMDTVWVSPLNNNLSPTGSRVKRTYERPTIVNA